MALAWGWDVLQQHAKEQKAVCLKAAGTKKRFDAMQTRGIDRSKAGAFSWWVHLRRTHTGVGKLRDRKGLCLKSRRWACWCAYVQAALHEDLEHARAASRLEFQGALEHALQLSCTVLEDLNGRFIEALDRRRRLLVKRVLLATWQEVVCHRERQVAIKHAGSLRLLHFIDALARGRHTQMKQEAFLAGRLACGEGGGGCEGSRGSGASLVALP